MKKYRLILSIILVFVLAAALVGCKDKKVNIEKIEISETPMITSCVGEDLTISGGKLKVTYSDDSTKNVDITVGMISGFDKTSSAEQTLTVTYEGKTATFTGTAKIELSSIAVKKAPDKTSYVAGETFNPAGLILTVTYSDNTEKEIVYSEDAGITIDKTGALAVSDTNVVVTYGGKTAEIAITVTPAESTEIKSIEITTRPNKTSYVAGEIFNPAGLILTVTYSDNTKKEIAYSEDAGITIDKTGALTAGDTKVVVTYGGKTAEIAITVAVKNLDSIEITVQPNKTSYLEGERFDPAGLVVTAVYNNGTKEAVTAYSIDKTRALVPGDKVIIVSYGGKTAEIEVKVAAKTLEKIEITIQPDKTSYLEGERFDPAGLVVTAVFNNGTTRTVTDYTIDKTDVLTTSDTKVVVTYGGKTAEIVIKVAAKSLKNIEITAQPDKTSYMAGEKFDPAGLVVTAVYDNGTRKVVTGYTIDKTDALAIGDTKIVVTYGGKTAEIAITVVDSSEYGITSDFDADGKYVVDEPFNVTYSFATTKNNGLGYDKVLFFIDGDLSNVKIIAKDSNGTEWDVAQIGFWGPAGGFAVAADYSADTTFTVTAASAGTYKVKVSAYTTDETNAKIDLIAENEIEVTIIGSGSSEYGITSDFDADGKYVVDEPFNVTYSFATTKENKLGYDKVLFFIDGDLSNVKIIAKDSNGTEWDVAQIGFWGPAGGFAVAADYSADTTFTVTATSAGTYKVKVSAYTTDETNAKLDLIAENEIEVTIIGTGRSEYAMDADYDWMNTDIISGQPVKMDVRLYTNVENQDGYDNVLVFVEILDKPEGATVSMIGEDTNGNKWDVAEIGFWGPAGGFPISSNYDVTSSFDVTFSMAGDYTIVIYAYTTNASNEQVDILCSSSLTLTVA